MRFSPKFWGLILWLGVAFLPGKAGAELPVLESPLCSGALHSPKSEKDFAELGRALLRARDEHPGNERVFAITAKIGHIIWALDHPDERGRVFRRRDLATYLRTLWIALHEVGSCRKGPEVPDPRSCVASSKSKGACFRCAYDLLRRPDVRAMGPQRACDQSNRLCGSRIQCGGCGPAADPDLTFPCLTGSEFSALRGGPGAAITALKDRIEKKANSALHLPSCGGTVEGADKLSHCWAFCTASRCAAELAAYGGAIVGGYGGLQEAREQARNQVSQRERAESRKEEDPNDREANRRGARCGDIGSDCFACCVRETYEMTFE